MNEKKLTELMKDDAFFAKIMEATTAKEVKDLFKERGMELTDEEVKSLLQMIEQSVQSSGELSEDDLENVAGGITVDNSQAIAAGVGSLATLTVIGSAVALYKIGHKLGYKKAKKDMDPDGFYNL